MTDKTSYLVVDLGTGEVYETFARSKEHALKVVIDNHYPEWTEDGWVEGEGMFEETGYDKFLVTSERYSKSFQPISRSFNE